MEAIGYVLLFFARKGHLPWMDFEEVTSFAQLKSK
jgi:hypothetical protein